MPSTTTFWLSRDHNISCHKWDIPSHVGLNGVSLVTLAPELPGALEAIEGLTREGVVVSMGHTLATIDQVG